MGCIHKHGIETTHHHLLYNMEKRRKKKMGGGSRMNRIHLEFVKIGVVGGGQTEEQPTRNKLLAELTARPQLDYHEVFCRNDVTL